MGDSGGPHFASAGPLHPGTDIENAQPALKTAQNVRGEMVLYKNTGKTHENSLAHPDYAIIPWKEAPPATLSATVPSREMRVSYQAHPDANIPLTRKFVLHVVGTLTLAAGTVAGDTYDYLGPSILDSIDVYINGERFPQKRMERDANYFRTIFSFGSDLEAQEITHYGLSAGGGAAHAARAGHPTDAHPDYWGGPVHYVVPAVPVPIPFDFLVDVTPPCWDNSQLRHMGAVPCEIGITLAETQRWVRCCGAATDGNELAGATLTSLTFYEVRERHSQEVTKIHAEADSTPFVKSDYTLMDSFPLVSSAVATAQKVQNLTYKATVPFALLYPESLAAATVYFCTHPFVTPFSFTEWNIEDLHGRKLNNDFNWTPALSNRFQLPVFRQSFYAFRAGASPGVGGTPTNIRGYLENRWGMINFSNDPRSAVLDAEVDGVLVLGPELRFHVQYVAPGTTKLMVVHPRYATYQLDANYKADYKSLP